jgi:hypothetical protein
MASSNAIAAINCFMGAPCLSRGGGSHDAGFFFVEDGTKGCGKLFETL